MYHSDPKAYSSLVNKMQDDTFVIRETEHNNVLINMVNRAVMANKHIIKNFVKGSVVLDIACGEGYNTCYLATEGYFVKGFDISENAIIEAKKLAADLGLPNDNTIFTVNDHSFLEAIEDESVDIVCALGLMRFLESDVIDVIYKEVFRILKPGGSFIVSNENVLFDIFASNDTTLKFWAGLMEDFSDVGRLFPEGSILKAMQEKITVPQRNFHPKRISYHNKRHVENPLTYDNTMKAYGFMLDSIVYPDCHIIPPYLLPDVDPVEVEKIRGEVCLIRAEGDWRSMFLGFEFLAFLKK